MPNGDEGEWQPWSCLLHSGRLGPSGPSHTEKAPPKQRLEKGYGGWVSLLGWAFMGVGVTCVLRKGPRPKSADHGELRPPGLPNFRRGSDPVWRWRKGDAEVGERISVLGREALSDRTSFYWEAMRPRPGDNPAGPS